MATDKNGDRLQFPQQLVLRLLEDETDASAPGIAVTLRLFAPRKNDYNLGPPLSNDDGVIVITEEWVRRGVEYESNTFIMDYASTLEDCSPQVRINVMSGEEISRAMRAMELYRTENGGPGIARTRSDLMNAENQLYAPQEIYVDLNVPGTPIKEIQIRLHRLK